MIMSDNNNNNKSRVVPDTDLAGYPAAGYPAKILPDTGYPAGYPA